MSIIVDPDTGPVGAISADAAERAYGCLWHDITSVAPQVRHARELLRDTLPLEARKRGIQYALDTFGPVPVERAFSEPMERISDALRAKAAAEDARR